METYITDRYGYIMDVCTGFGTATNDSFMAGHDYMIGADGAKYYNCNHYAPAQMTKKEADKNDCEIAMEHGIDHCQCGQHD